MIYKSYYKSKIGDMVLLSDDNELIRLDFVSSRYIDEIEKIDSIINDDLEIFNVTKKWLDRYFNRENPNPKEIPIKLIGSSFQMKVWDILKQIPYGKTITYGEIAKKINPHMSCRAVGHAVGKNPISIIVPCHRVIGSNNRLTGYASGIDKKIKLLEIEKINFCNKK